MQFTRSLLTVALVGSLIIAPAKAVFGLSDNGKKLVAAGLALGVGYLYARKAANNPNSHPVVKAFDFGTNGLHTATNFVSSWVPTAGVASAIFWAAYHNKNIANTHAVHFVKDMLLSATNPTITKLGE